MINTVVFDFFGVISSEVAPFIFGEAFAPEEAKRLKEEYMQPADRGDITEREMYENLARLFSRTPKEMEEEYLRRAVIDRRMVSLIEKISETHRVCLLSNAQSDYLRKIFDREGLDSLFDYKVVSGDVRMIKPSPEIFEHLLSLVGIAPPEAVFIDDNPKNVEGARAVGMQAIVFTTPEDAAKELRKLGVEI